MSAPSVMTMFRNLQHGAQSRGLLPQDTWDSVMTLFNNLQPKTRLYGLLLDDTWDLLDIWLGCPSTLELLENNMDAPGCVFLAVKHLLTMDFQSGASDFGYLFPFILLILASCAFGAYLDVVHHFFGTLLAAGCCYAVQCMYAFAGHSVLHLGEAMDKENVLKTRVDTDVLAALVFLGMLVSESLAQLILFTLLGGYLGIFLSLIITLVMLRAATMANHTKVALTIYDERELRKTARTERKNKMDEQEKKIAKLESTSEGLRFHLRSHQQKYDQLQEASIDLQRMSYQNRQELQRCQGALTDARAVIDNLLSANSVLQSTLVKAYKSHAHALAANEKHYAEEFAKEKTHVEQLARQAMHAELKRKIESNNNKFARLSVVRQQFYNHVSAKKDKEHVEALAMKEKQHQETLTEEKAEAENAGRREALMYCRRWLESSAEEAERRHTDNLAQAILERDKLHKETLAKTISEKDESHEKALWEKEKEAKEEYEKLREAHAESHMEVVAFYSDLIEEKRNEHMMRIAEKERELEDLLENKTIEHATKIAEKQQELDDIKALMDRHPELWLAEEDAEDSEDSEDLDGYADNEDECYVTMSDHEEAELQDVSKDEFQDDEDAQSQSDEDTDSECETDDEFEDEPCKIENKESNIDFNIDGDDSEDELRQWAVVDSDFEQDG